MTTVTIASTQWEVSLATTLAEKTAGLGGIEAIHTNTGMLFVYDTVQLVLVTTVPMFFILDILFFDENLVVTGIERFVSPGNEISAACMYFMEVNGGETLGVELGMQAVITELPTQQPMDLSALISGMVVIMMMTMMMKQI